MKENETKKVTMLEKAYLGPMTSGKKYAAKNALITKKREGMSDDFKSLLDFHGIDSERLESFLSKCEVLDKAESFYVIRNNNSGEFLEDFVDGQFYWTDFKNDAKHFANKDVCTVEKKRLDKFAKEYNQSENLKGDNAIKLGVLMNNLPVGSYKLSLAQEKEWDKILLDSKKNLNKNKKDRAIVDMWDRYHNVVVQCKNDLSRRNAGHKAVLESSIIEDYEDESFETFLHALSIVEIPRLAHMKGSWTFWYTFKAYLIARNKSIIKQHMEKISNECGEWTKSEDGEDISVFETDLGKTSSPEEDFFINQQSKVLREAIPNAYRKFNNTQKVIWDLKEKGHNKADISNNTGITLVDINKNLRAMKLLVSNEIKNTSFKYNVSVEW